MKHIYLFAATIVVVCPFLFTFLPDWYILVYMASASVLAMRTFFKELS